MGYTHVHVLHVNTCTCILYGCVYTVDYTITIHMYMYTVWVWLYSGLYYNYTHVHVYCMGVVIQWTVL